MTEAQLLELIATNDARKLVSALAVLNKKQRRKLSKAAQQSYKEVKKEYDDYVRGISIFSLDSPGRDQLFVSILAVLALGPFGTAKRALSNFWTITHQSEYKELVAEVLNDRRPEWLEKWANQALRTDDLWSIVRKLVKTGALKKPDSDDYIIQMYAQRLGHDEHSLKVRLSKDPALLDKEIWQIFDVASTPNVLFHPDDDPQSARYAWSPTLIALANEGQIDRQRLLAESIRALTLGPRKSNTTWFYSLHERLKPTHSERISLQGTYLDLLKSSTPAVVGFALKALREIQKAKQLDNKGLLDKVAEVFNVETKGPAIEALKMIEKLVAQDASLKELAAQKAIQALVHSNVDVQSKAVDLITCLAPIAPALQSTLAQYRESVASSVQGKIDGLIGPVGQVSSETNSVERNSLLEELETYPAKYKEYVRLDEIIQSYESGFCLAPVAFAPYDVPRLKDKALLQPVKDIDELIERLTVFIETGADADEFELLVDAISRLCDQRPKDLRQRTEPLLKRASASRSKYDVFSRLIFAWADSSRTSSKEPYNVEKVFVWQRTVELCNRILSRQAAPNLSCPTHSGGWISPVVFIERLKHYQGNELPILPLDFHQALLRLAPDGRDEALEKLRELGLQKEDVIAKCLSNEFGQELLRARWQISLNVAHVERLRKPNLDELSDLHVKLRLPRWDCGAQACGGVVSMVDLAARCEDNIWPADPSATFALGTKRILKTIDHGACAWDSKTTYFDRLFDPDQLYGKPARYLILSSLMAKDGDVRGLAIDALIDAISDGRVTGQQMGKDLRDFFKHKVVKANRFAEGLVAVSRQSVLHIYVCSEILQAALAEQRLPQGVHHLLQCLLEWLIELKAPISVGVRETLSEVEGNSKTAKLAKKLLARKDEWSDEIRSAVLDEALVGRCERIRRWLG